MQRKEDCIGCNWIRRERGEEWLPAECPDCEDLKTLTVPSLCSQTLGDHLVVWKEDGSDGITWDELQALKDEILGPEVACVEVYPPASQVVNEVNRRHLWVIDWDSCPFRLSRKFHL